MSVHHTTGRPLLGMPDDGPRCSRCKAVLAHDHNDPMCSPCMETQPVTVKAKRERAVNFRPPPPDAGQNRHRHLTTERKDEIERLYREGMPTIEIVRTMKTSGGGLYAVLAERGVPRRQRRNTCVQGAEKG